MNESGGDTETRMAHITAALARYVDYGIRPGGWLTAVLANDLEQSVGRADEESVRLLPEVVRYVYNNLPSGCWGSYERVNQWFGRLAR